MQPINRASARSSYCSLGYEPQVSTLIELWWAGQGVSRCKSMYFYLMGLRGFCFEHAVFMTLRN